MYKTIILSFWFYFFSGTLISQNNNSKFKKIKELGDIEEYNYTPNNLNILLLQDNSAPVVTVQVVYRVGSKNEVLGNTGATHLLEHLNFKGTPTFNKKNGNAIFSVLQGVGAQMNATTWYDRTNYYETIPSDKIELALHIESDRMRNSLLLKEDKDSEMTVVRNEFERGENNPISILNKEIWAAAYMAHPYHHSTIGWRSDIENMPIEVLRDFYNTYYWPNNATLTIIGDFNKTNLFNLIDKYFGNIPKSPKKMPVPYTEEPEQFGPRRIVIKKPGQQGVVSIGYKIPGNLHHDLPALEVLSQIIGSGTSSEINKTFVDKGFAIYGYASVSNFKDTGIFTITLGINPNKNHENINNQMLEMIETIKKEGVLQEDIDRIVAKIRAQTILSRDGSGSIASQLNENIASGDWADFYNAIDRLSKVKSADIKRVANKYLVENQSTTGYFIPIISGNNILKEEKETNFTNNDLGKYFYRHSKENFNLSDFNSASKTSISGINLNYEDEKLNDNNDTFTREKVAGIDVISAKTGAKDFITLVGSFPISQYLKTNSNRMVPTLAVQMLSKGTTKNNKFQFSQKLEKLGVNLNVSAQTHTIDISFKCLKKDINEVINLLAEKLRNPLFDEKEFELLKNQNEGHMKQALTDPGEQGSIALSQTIYPKEHPNYNKDVQSSIDELNNVTLSDIKKFHKTYFGSEGLKLVAVGDVDAKVLHLALKESFKNWKGGLHTSVKYENFKKVDALTKVITIPQKPSAEMYIGQYTGIQINDKDFMPFYIGTSILGGGFSGRLMQTVRDNDGLTYGISAYHSGQDYSGGYWVVNASFNPSLFQKGLEATMVQIEKWVNMGVTEEELAIKKINLTGSYKVGLSTTRGLAYTILNFVKRGFEPNYVYQYPKDIEAVTLKEVNTAIKANIDLNKLVIIKSGSLDKDGNPLNN